MALDEGAPNPKRMRLQHSFEGRKKACLILRCFAPSRLERMIKYNIFIVDDLNADIVDDGFPRVSPTFQIDCGAPAMDAFCVLSGTLYMFEGCIQDDDGRKSVFAIDLALTQTLTQETSKLEKGGALLKKIGDMPSPKAVPVALPTPDGEKILVFSTEKISGSVFELFEPAKGSWEQLPSIPGFWRSISLYGFIDNSQSLLVQTQYAEIYVIDLAPPVKHWEKLDASNFYSGLRHIPPWVAEPSFFEAVLGNRFCFVNLFGFYDLEDHVAEGNPRNVIGCGFSSPESFNLGLASGLTTDFCVSLLNYDKDGKEILFCDLLMEKPEDNAESCRLAIAVCRVDLESYKKEREELKNEGYAWTNSFDKSSNTTIVKAHKFTLVFDGLCHVEPTHLFFTF